MSNTPAPTDNWPEVKAASAATLDDDIVAYIEQCLQRAQPKSHLIGVLHRVQDRYGYLDRTHLDAVAQLMQIPAAEVTGVASFYHLFRLEPRGRFVINLCMGTACYVKGAEEIARRIRDELGIDFGETTKDGLFSLEASRCLGTCGLAPVMMVNDDVHAKVTPDQVSVLLRQYVQQARHA